MVLFGQGFNTLISFLFFPYLARTLSVENYGTYGQTILITDLIKCFFIMGLTNVIYVQLSDKTQNFSTVFKSNLLFSFISGLAGTLFVFGSSGYLSVWFNNPSMTTFIEILSFGLIFQIPYDYLNAVLIYSGKVKQSVIITVITNIFKIALLFVSIHILHSMEMVFITFLVTNVIQFICIFFVIPKEFYTQGGVDLKIMRSQFKLSLPIIISALLGHLLKFADGLMVSSLLTVKDYAVFRNGAFEIPLISIVYSSVSSIILPEVSTLSAADQNNQIVELKRKVSSSVSLLTIPIAIFVLLFSVPIITLLFGDNYAESASVFFIINLLVLIRINDYQDILILRSAGKYILFYNIICLVLNIIFAYFFISYFGVIGAAIGTTLSIYLFALLLLKKSTSLIGVGLFQFFDKKVLLPVFLISLISGILLYIPYYLFPNKYFVLPLGFIYIAVVYFTFYKKQLFQLPMIQAILLKFFNIKRG
ncbi:MAG: uncharacterized protein K0S44_1001 [Bacteroidetes bacterium]|nr:uncharacterized protein [Bacteroidota bacterium]